MISSCHHPRRRKERIITHIHIHHRKYLFALGTTCGYLIVKLIIIMPIYLYFSYYMGKFTVEYQNEIEYYNMGIFEDMKIQNHIQDEKLYPTTYYH